MMARLSKAYNGNVAACPFGLVMLEPNEIQLVLFRTYTAEEESTLMKLNSGLKSTRVI